MNNAPRVALIRNRIYPGGVFHVMLEMIQVFNKRGIIPDLVTLKSKVSPKTAAEKYNVNVDFRIREILTDIRIPYEWHIILFNKISRGILADYDLVINHNNTSFLYNRPASQKLIHYIHFPRKARGLSNLASIHLPEGQKKRWYHLRHDPFKLASLAYRFDTKTDDHELFLTNSNYTRQALLDCYDLPEGKARVMYPPVDVADELPSDKKNEQLIVSLGRFSPEKRQLAQLEIARRLPGYRFKLMGFLSDPGYFNKCKNFKEQHKLDHVELLPNLDFYEINKILDHAGIFLHAIQNEPFGITTVKAISHGCIPIVPDSGGQIEIVPIKSLRWQHVSDGVGLIKQLKKKSEGEKQELRRSLLDRIMEFKTQNFHHQFDKLLNDIIRLKQ